MSANPAHDRWSQPARIPEQLAAGRQTAADNPVTHSGAHSSTNSGSDNASRTILVCDDWPQVRDAITTVLADLPRFRVVGEAADSASCLAQIAELQPDVLILDVSIPGGGAQVAKAAKQLDPGLHIVVYSGRQDRRTQQEMFAAGADQFVVKTGRVRPLVEALDHTFPAPAASAQGA